MEQHWFKSFGWMYLPIYGMEYIIMPAIIFMVPAVMELSETGILYQIISIPFLFLTFALFSGGIGWREKTC